MNSLLSVLKKPFFSFFLIDAFTLNIHINNIHIINRRIMFKATNGTGVHKKFLYIEETGARRHFCVIISTLCICSIILTKKLTLTLLLDGAVQTRS